MMKRFYRILSLSLALMLLLCALPAFASSASGGIPGYVTANTMKVYQYPNPFSKLLGTMTYGEAVLVLAAQDGWLKLKNVDGEIGYCEAGGLSKKNPALNMYGYVKETGAYVYAKPGIGFKTIAKVTMGDELHVVGMTKDKVWLRVKNGSKYGYVLTELVSKTPTWKGLIS